MAAESQLLLQNRQHLRLRLFDIADGSVIVKQAVIIPVGWIKTHLHGSDKIDRSNQYGKKGKQSRHVMGRRPVKEPFHLHLQRSEIHDDQMGKQTDIDKSAGKSQGTVFIKPAQKSVFAPVAFGKIVQQQFIVPYHQHAVGDDDAKHQAGNADPADDDQNQGKEKSQQQRHGEGKHDPFVVLDRRQIYDFHPHHDQNQRKPKT